MEIHKRTQHGEFIVSGIDTKELRELTGVQHLLALEYYSTKLGIEREMDSCKSSEIYQTLSEMLAALDRDFTRMLKSWFDDIGDNVGICVRFERDEQGQFISLKFHIIFNKEINDIMGADATIKPAEMPIAMDMKAAIKPNVSAYGKYQGSPYVMPQSKIDGIVKGFLRGHKGKFFK